MSVKESHIEKTDKTRADVLVNRQQLLATLAQLTHEELDEILDARDGGEFDVAWQVAYETVALLLKAHCAPIPVFDSKDLFIALSNATQCHEICSYIADDLALIHNAKWVEYHHELLVQMRECYGKGAIPGHRAECGV
uniref:hypothetical protein n=1 Tax=Thaumasiovibrio occultus TaxID=1891184 RepID=UPI000B34B621|nr:hypothetical protein [Thaumasiovibrio occultus]